MKKPQKNQNPSSLHTEGKSDIVISMVHTETLRIVWEEDVERRPNNRRWFGKVDGKQRCILTEDQKLKRPFLLAFHGQQRYYVTEERARTGAEKLALLLYGPAPVASEPIVELVQVKIHRLMLPKTGGEYVGDVSGTLEECIEHCKSILQADSPQMRPYVKLELRNPTFPGFCVFDLCLQTRYWIRGYIVDDRRPNHITHTNMGYSALLVARTRLEE